MRQRIKRVTKVQRMAKSANECTCNEEWPRVTKCGESTYTMRENVTKVKEVKEVKKCDKACQSATKVRAMCNVG